jgi:hypothetical protein
MGDSFPMWVPGEVERGTGREAPGVLAGLRADATGLYGDLPAGVGPLLEMSASLIARAFAAFAAGDWETCDALIWEGLEAAESVFTGLVGHVVSGGFRYRVDSPAWPEFLVHLAFLAEPLPPASPPPAPARPGPPLSR